jgi:two-component system, OmpR family, response regulator
MHAPFRVLVVDDNQDTANSLAFLLGTAGFVAETAFDGPSALQTAERFEPDACILDIAMPGMNGYQLARRLRALAKHTPPVLATMTAYSDFRHLDRAAQVGFDLHFTKPASPADIAEQLQDLLSRQALCPH